MRRQRAAQRADAVRLGGDLRLQPPREPVALGALPAVAAAGLAVLPQAAHVVDERQAQPPRRDQRRGGVDVVRAGDDHPGAALRQPFLQPVGGGGPEIRERSLAQRRGGEAAPGDVPDHLAVGRVSDRDGVTAIPGIAGPRGAEHLEARRRQRLNHVPGAHGVAAAVMRLRQMRHIGDRRAARRGARGARRRGQAFGGQKRRVARARQPRRRGVGGAGGHQRRRRRQRAGLRQRLRGRRRARRPYPRRRRRQALRRQRPQRRQRAGGVEQQPRARGGVAGPVGRQRRQRRRSVPPSGQHVGDQNVGDQNVGDQNGGGVGRFALRRRPPRSPRRRRCGCAGLGAGLGAGTGAVGARQPDQPPGQRRHPPGRPAAVEHVAADPVGHRVGKDRAIGVRDRAPVVAGLIARRPAVGHRGGPQRRSRML